MPLDEKTTTELEAAAFRRLLEHLRARAGLEAELGAHQRDQAFRIDLGRV